MKNPKVSVCMVTYNQENFIAQAIECALMQKTDFDYEIVIGEDCSTDRTREVVVDYQKKHPDKIKTLLHPYNLGPVHSPGKNNFIKTLKICKGRYIALCEGDDYWTDPLKLQKQVDFLEANPEYSFCTTRYMEKNLETGKCLEDSYDHLFTETEKGIVIDYGVFFKYWLTQPLTALFVKEKLSNIYKEIKFYHLFRDVHIFFLLLKHYRKGYCLNFYSGVYQIHSSGVWSQNSEEQRYIISFEIYKELYKKNKQNIFLKQEFLRKVSLVLDYYFINNLSIKKRYKWLFIYLYYHKSIGHKKEIVFKDMKSILKNFIKKR